MLQYLSNDSIDALLFGSMLKYLARSQATTTLWGDNFELPAHSSTRPVKYTQGIIHKCTDIGPSMAKTQSLGPGPWARYDFHLDLFIEIRSGTLCEKAA